MDRAPGLPDRTLFADELEGLLRAWEISAQCMNNPEWREHMAELTIDDFVDALPPGSACRCWCHTTPGVKHVRPCCAPGVSS